MIGASIKIYSDLIGTQEPQQEDYWTKHHSPTHHHNTRSDILTPDKVVLDLHERLQKMSNAHKQAPMEGTVTQNK